MSSPTSNMGKTRSTVFAKVDHTASEPSSGVVLTKMLFDRSLWSLHIPNIIGVGIMLFIGSIRLMNKCASSLTAIPEYDPNSSVYDHARTRMDEAMLKGLPDMSLYCFGELAVVFTIGTLNIMVLGYYMAGKLLPVKPGRTIFWSAVFFYTALSIPSRYYAMENEKSHVPIRLFLGLVLGVYVVIIAVPTSWTYPAGAPELKVLRRLYITMLQFCAIFFVGFYVAFLFATRYFFIIQENIRKISKSDPDNLVLSGIQVIMEFVIVSAFFSLFIPLWQKLYAGRYWLFCHIYADHFKLDDDELRHFLQRTMFFCNYQLDAIRYVMSRGVLFKMSYFWMFVLLVFKDSTYQFWHFGFKYCQDIVALNVKMAHPEGKKGFKGCFATMARYVELFVKAMGIPKKLAVSWFLDVDFRETIPNGKMLGETKLAIGMQFCNMKLVIFNVPELYGFDAVGASQDLESAQLGPNLLKEDRENNSKLLDNLDKEPSYGRERSIRRDSDTDRSDNPEHSGDCSDMVGKTMSTMSENQTGRSMSRMSRHASTQRPKKSLRLPLEDDDHAFSDGIKDVWQTIIFLRYQCRCAVKIAVSIAFISGALVWQMTDSKHLPGVLSPYESYRSNQNYLIAGIVFLATDAIEWIILHRWVLLREARVPQDRLDSFKECMADPWLRGACVMNMFFYSLYMVTATYDPFNAGAWQRHFAYNEGYFYKPGTSDVVVQTYNPVTTNSTWNQLESASEVTDLLTLRIWDICAGRATSNCVCDTAKSCRDALCA